MKQHKEQDTYIIHYTRKMLKTSTGRANEGVSQKGLDVAKHVAYKVVSIQKVRLFVIV